MPDCYYLCRSHPTKTAKDVKDCVREVGGPGEARNFKTDGRKVHAWVHYESLADALNYLEDIKECIESKGHVVEDHRVLHDFDEVGLKIED